MFWAEKLFEFPIFAEKSDSISVKTFFFLETICFLSEKFRLKFRTNHVKLIQE